MIQYTEDSAEEIEQLLVGHRIVLCEKGLFTVRGSNEDATGRLTLEDGTQIYVLPNTCACSCGDGDYALTHLTKVDNVITSVRLTAEGQDEDFATSYRIYVVADNQEINAVQVDGKDGNGYYGTGYELVVRRDQLPGA